MSGDDVRHHDAIVVGGGPAGATAAILLARAGRRVALVEKRRFPRTKVCGECLAASNLPLLASLGVVDAIEREAGAELHRVTLMQGGRTVRAALPKAPSARFPRGRAVGRESLDTHLLERARGDGVNVLQPWSARAVSGRPGAWRCDVREASTGERATLGAPVLIDAHGSWEPLVSARQPPTPGHRASDLLAFKANFTDTAHPDGEISVLALDGGYGGMVRGHDGVTTVAGCVRRDRLDALRRGAPGRRAGETVGAWFAAECTGVARALDGASLESGWLAAGPLRPGVRVAHPDGLFRIGNAGAEAHPILGEGMSIALQSGALLASLLAAEPDWSEHGMARANARLRVRHAAAWNRRFRLRLALAATFAHAAMRPPSARALLALADRWPALLTHGARWGGKTRALDVSLPIARAAEEPA